MATIAGGEEKKINREVLEVRNEEKEQRTQLAEELESFILNKEHPEKNIQHECRLEAEQKEAIKILVRGHANSFS